MSAEEEQPPRGPRTLRALGAEGRRRLLDFAAPYLIEKLVYEGVVPTQAQALVLFEELKKYFLLCCETRLTLPMSSVLVDATWHQFALFTKEYESFCLECVGTFCHHAPTIPSQPTSDATTVADYVSVYESQFGPLPAVWRDWECLSPASRLRRRRGAEFLTAQMQASSAVLVRGGDAAEVVCRTSARARPALEFIAREPTFLVRELPGLHTAEEGLTLVRPLVQYRILRLAL